MLLLIVFIKYVAAFRAELWRIHWIFRGPSAFIALIERSTFGFFTSAVLTELAHVYGAAGTGPAVFCRLRFAAVYAKLAGIAGMTAYTSPS